MSMYVGLDIAKKRFEAALPHGKNYRVVSLPNTDAGFERLFEMLSVETTCVMEASGPYGYRLAAYLHERSVAIAVVNPLVIKRFAQMLLSRTKTDKADAVLIARYAEKMEPELWHPASSEISELQQQRTAVDQLMKQRTQLRNALEALEVLPHQSHAAQEALRRVLRQVEESIEALERRMQAVLKEHFAELEGLLRSIKGIGPKTTLELIVITQGFTRFSTAKQLVAYLGLCPRIYESGTSVRGKARLSKMGLGRTRRMLYMCAQSAIRYNVTCRAFYERLVDSGKPGMVALMAVAHKLMRQAFAVVTKGRPFVNGYGLQTT